MPPDPGRSSSHPRDARLHRKLHGLQPEPDTTPLAIPPGRYQGRPQRLNCLRQLDPADVTVVFRHRTSEIQHEAIRPGTPDIPESHPLVRLAVRLGAGQRIITQSAMASARSQTRHAPTTTSIHGCSPAQAAGPLICQ